MRSGEGDVALASTGATLHSVASIGTYDPFLPLRVARLVRKLKPDIVHTWLSLMDVFAGAARLFDRVPRVLSERSDVAGYRDSAFIRARIAMGRRAAAIVTNSEGGRSYWSNFVDESRIHLVPNIVPLAEIDGAAARRDTGDEPIILFAGRFSSERNVERLLDALALVFPLGSARAVFCGDGPLRAAMEQKTRDLGIADRCLFLGEVSDVWSWMKSASVLVSVSVFEGEPNAVLEAIACGTPLVLSDIPAHRALGGESAARMVDAFSADSIASGIEAVLVRRDEATRRARNALQSIEGRSSADIAAGYAEIYRGVRRGRT